MDPVHLQEQTSTKGQGKYESIAPILLEDAAGDANVQGCVTDLPLTRMEKPVHRGTNHQSSVHLRKAANTVSTREATSTTDPTTPPPQQRLQPSKPCAQTFDPFPTCQSCAQDTHSKQDCTSAPAEAGPSTCSG